MLRVPSIALLLITWYAASLFAGERLLPGPEAVLAAIVAEARSGALALHLAATLARVALAFSLAMVIIILAYIWGGLTEAAAIAAVAVNKLPNTIVTIREGARALDPALDEMARVFAMPRARAIRHVVMPQVAPYFAAAARSGLSLVWKIVLVVELLGRPNGVGFEMGIAFQLFDVTRIIAYALVFVAVMLTIETVVVQPLERRASRWRVRTA